MFRLIDPVQLTEAPAGSSDTELVAAVLRKDRKAAAEFVNLHADAVYAYVSRRLIPRADLVDDLVQEVFLAAWEKLDGFRGTGSLRQWLLGIARHKVEDYYRSRLREVAPVVDMATERALDAAVPPQLDEAMDRERIEQRARRILAGLPEVYSLALLWRYWEHRTVQEMAAQAGRTEKAMERLLARARAQFERRWMDEPSDRG